MYTYKDFEDKVKEYGFTDGQISDADYRLAQYNPDAGVALLGYKNDWLTATNDSAKAMAHAAAEDIRTRYGNYSGGGNGGSFTPTGTEEYDDPWETAIQSTIRSLNNRKFEWSPETDPTVKYYEDAYRREGERAMKDTLGAVAATTGGIPSSYATAAAAQQRNYYAQQMTDKYPELYQQAFERFMKEYENEYGMLDMYSQLSRDETDKWYKEQDIGLRGRDLDITENQNAETNKIAWAELGLQDKDMQQKYELEFTKLNQDDQQFAKELLYKYDVLSEEGKQFWAKLAQDGEIADAEIKYKYDALDQNTKNFLMEYALEVSKFEEETKIAWAEIGIKQEDLAKHYELEFTKLNQDDQQFAKELLYKYDVLSEEGKQFWAKLAQDGEIADAEIKYKYDALDQNTQNFLMEYALDVERLGFEKEKHANEVRLTEAEIQLQYDKMDQDKKTHLQNLALSYYQLAQQADQWSEEMGIMAQELGLERDKLKRDATLDQIELAYAAAEIGDFSRLKDLGVDTSGYEALWNSTVYGTGGGEGTETAGTSVNDAVAGETGNTFGSSYGRPSKKTDGTWDMNVLLAKEKEGRPLTDEEKAALAVYHQTMGHVK